MENINNSPYTYNNIINLRSELLFREAEDDFYYFNKINCAYSKLKQAVKITPNFTKGKIFLANVSFIKGFYKKALNLYFDTLNSSNDNGLIIASIANCYYALKNYEESLKYCDEALSIIHNFDTELKIQLLEIKINSLLNLKKYNLAYKASLLLEKEKNNDFLKEDLSLDLESLNKKLQLQKKLKYLGLKIV